MTRERGEAQKGYGPQSFSIKYNNAATNDPCAVCGEGTDLRVGPELFLRKDSWEPVCYRCGRERAPVLAACLQAFRDEYEPRFGACPECGRPGEHMGIHKTNWFVCSVHEVCWFAGSGLFSAWLKETEEDWELRARTMYGYREVEPLHHPEAIVAARRRDEELQHRKLMADLGPRPRETEDPADIYS